MIISFREKYLLSMAGDKNNPSAYPWNVSMESKVQHDGKRETDPYIPSGLRVNRIKINDKLLRVKNDDKKFMNWETINQLDSPVIQNISKTGKDN